MIIYSFFRIQLDSVIKLLLFTSFLHFTTNSDVLIERWKRKASKCYCMKETIDPFCSRTLRYIIYTETCTLFFFNVTWCKTENIKIFCEQLSFSNKTLKNKSLICYQNNDNISAKLGPVYKLVKMELLYIILWQPYNLRQHDHIKIEQILRWCRIDYETVNIVTSFCKCIEDDEIVHCSSTVWWQVGP